MSVVLDEMNKNGNVKKMIENLNLVEYSNMLISFFLGSFIKILLLVLDNLVFRAMNFYRNNVHIISR